MNHSDEKGLAIQAYNECCSGENPENKSHIKSGIVCFFDILGYKSIMENNSLESIHTIIEEIFYKTPDDVVNQLTKGGNDALNEEIRETITNHIKHIIVSDSIVVFIDTENLTTNEIRLIDGVFVFYISFLFRLFFNRGLPMRAGIAFGEYLIYESTFAGKTIVESYSLSDSLEFSGLAMKEETFDKIKVFFEKKSISTKLLTTQFIKFTSPTKNGDQSLYQLNWMGRSFKCHDTEQRAFNCFHAHGKTSNQSVMNKIKNTVNTIRYFKFIKTTPKTLEPQL